MASLLSIPLLLGALWAHAGSGWVFSSEGGGWEFPLLLVVLAAAIAIQGNGPFSLRDRRFYPTVSAGITRTFFPNQNA